MLSKIKNPVNTMLYRVFCGVGENRTLVQTSNLMAFYTLSPGLDFRLKAWPETATHSLVLLFSKGG